MPAERTADAEASSPSVLDSESESIVAEPVCGVCASPICGGAEECCSTGASSTIATAPVVQAESELSRLAAPRPFAQVHPRWTGGIWFAAAGFVAGSGFGVFSTVITLVSQSAYAISALTGIFLGSLLIAVLGAVCGFIPGVLFAAPICEGKTPTARRAGLRGILITVCAHFAASLMLAPVLPVHAMGIPLPFMILIGFVLSLLSCGILTLPVGYFAGKLLFKYRSKHLMRPKGCSLHGCRE